MLRELFLLLLHLRWLEAPGWLGCRLAMPAVPVTPALAASRETAAARLLLHLLLLHHRRTLLPPPPVRAGRGRVAAWCRRQS